MPVEAEGEGALFAGLGAALNPVPGATFVGAAAVEDAGLFAGVDPVVVPVVFELLPAALAELVLVEGADPMTNVADADPMLP